MKKLNGMVLAMGAAAAFALAPIAASAADEAEIMCQGANKCKGQSKCGAEKGKNDCAGKGIGMVAKDKCPADKVVHETKVAE